MKSYLSLVPISARVHKRQSRMTRICIILAVFLVTVIFSMTDMLLRAEKTEMLRKHGNYHMILQGIAKDSVELIRKRPDIAASSWYSEINLDAGADYYINGKKVVLYGIEETYITDIMDYPTEGDCPQNDREVVLSADAKELFDRLAAYGFLSVISFITVLNIMNSISIGVSARIKQYGAMRAVGMESRQVTKMITAEAVTYTACGTITGIIFGILLHYLIYVRLVITHFGGTWKVPVAAIMIILLLVSASCIAAVYAPSKRIRDMAITDTINEL